MPPRRLRNRLERSLTGAWYAPRPTVLATMLLPFGVVFATLSAIRRALFRGGALPARRLPCPVVVVGNVVAGGAGKTPLVRHLAQALRARGMRPGIVSRGHGGTTRQPLVVAQGDSAERVGDEPLLYAGDGLPVAVGVDRVAAARLLLDRHPEIDVIIADDGLQHYRLARDLEIVVVDAERGYGNGLPIPAGPLREPVSRLRRVDAIVVNGEAPTRAALPAGVPVFAMRLVAEAFRRVDDPSVRADLETFRGGCVDAVAGIAHPERFFAMLAALGVRARSHPFADHHPFVAGDFPADARVVLMTEKDAVRCRAFADQRFWSVPVRAEVEPPLSPWVEERIRGSQAARNPGLPGHQGAAGLR